jgi:acetyltransferase
MIRKELLQPESIAIIGASNDVSKPGGKVLFNILAHGYDGLLFAVNPKETTVQGVPCFADCSQLPCVDLAIIAVAANYVEPILYILAREKNCKAFILFSAGFGETGDAGKELQQRCRAIIDENRGTLIGPNCIGVITGSYKGVFAGPIPEYDSKGCDCVSASGATIVYLMEAAIPRGLKFRDIFSVGNSAQVSVEDVLQYWDESFDAETSSRIKLIYTEQINDPQKFLYHARSLVKKGCRIAAVKAGATEAGTRAVSSHTGALATPDTAVTALFRKAGIIRCYSRLELVYVAEIFTLKPLKGNRIAVITHAGGPGVMLTDILVRSGMQVPAIKGPKADALLKKLHPGSSVNNPIDFLATGNAEQLGYILDAVENDFDEIDGAAVVFGTTGMWNVDDVYMVLHEKMRDCKKPLFPILPSAIQAAEEVSHFHSMGHVNFTDEVSFGYVLSRINKMIGPFDETGHVIPAADKRIIRNIIDNSEAGYLDAATCFALLNAAGISTVEQKVLTSVGDVELTVNTIGLPVVMKVIGPLHKTDVGGVVTGIDTIADAKNTFIALMKIDGAVGVLMQQQLTGTEIYLGAKAEDKFGHLILCGLGGIFVEVFKDVSSGLAPVGKQEAKSMIRRLKSYPVIKGARGKTGVNESLIEEAILKLAALVQVAPEICELDINPLLGNQDYLIAVDGRIRL